ncbi:MAG TPA: hypothetical protein VGJ41_15315 [Nocardioides sp.]
MKYCGNCGTPASTGAFCGNCGAALDAPETQPTATPASPSSTPPSAAPSASGWQPSTPSDPEATVQRDRRTAGQPAPVTRPMPVEAPPISSGWGQAPQAPQAPQGAPAGPAQGSYGGPQLPTIDWRRLAVGNWLGAGITAAATLGSAGLAALILGLLAKPDNFGLDNTLTLVAAILGNIFGADLVVSADIDKDSVHTSLGVFPLTVSLLVAAVAIIVFRRVTARYPEPTAALTDAARAGLLVGVPLMLISIIFRSNTDKVGEGWAAMLMDLLDAKLKFGSSVFGSLFLGFLTVFFVLAISLFLRRDWWGPKVQKAHEWLAAPLYGAATTMALLPVAGLIGVGLLFIAGESNTASFDNSDDTMATLAFGFSILANAGMWLISLGSGAALGVDGSTSGGGGFGGGGGGDGLEQMRHLSYYAGDEPGLWAAPVVALAVLFASAYVVALRSSQPSAIFGNLMRWVGLQFLAIPYFLRLANVHMSFSEKSGKDSMRMHAFVGPSGVQATFFLAFLALLCAVGVAAMFRAIDVERLRAQFSAVATQLQSTPGQPAAGQPPAQQPASTGWGQPASQPAQSTGWGQSPDQPTTGHPTAPHQSAQPWGQPSGPASQVSEDRTQVRPDHDWTRRQDQGPWGPPTS